MVMFLKFLWIFVTAVALGFFAHYFRYEPIQNYEHTSIFWIG